MVNTSRRPKYACSRCEEAGMEGWVSGQLSSGKLTEGELGVFLAQQPYLDLSMRPSHHQLLRQSQLAIETLDGLFCFLSRKEADVSQKLPCLTGPHQL